MLASAAYLATVNASTATVPSIMSTAYALHTDFPAQHTAAFRHRMLRTHTWPHAEQGSAELVARQHPVTSGHTSCATGAAHFLSHAIHTHWQKHAVHGRHHPKQHSSECDSSKCTI